MEPRTPTLRYRLRMSISSAQASAPAYATAREYYDDTEMDVDAVIHWQEWGAKLSRDSRNNRDLAFELEPDHMEAQPSAADE